MTSHPKSGTAHTVEFRVRYAETDQMQVVYHSNYLIWCEIGRTEFIRALGNAVRGAGTAERDARRRRSEPSLSLGCPLR